MSVRTQILRLQAARDSIISAIAEKGVSVPSGTKLDGFAALIAAIETGGGLPESFVELATGTVTFANSGAAYEPSISHNAGFNPNFFIMIAEGTNVHTEFSGRAISYIIVKQTLGSYGAYYNYINAESTGRINSVGNVISASDTSSKLNAQTVVPIAWFKEGKTYRWYAGVLDNIS
jgi:hypothetical protein